MSFQFHFPDLGEGLHEAEIIRWLVHPGQYVKTDEPVAEVQTDKSVVEITSPVTGKVLSLAGEEGTIIHVGDILVTFEEQGRKDNEQIPSIDGGQTTKMATNQSSFESVYSSATQTKIRPKAAPTVRMLARELGINLDEVIGTGPGGRIIEADVRGFSQPIKLPQETKITTHARKEEIETKNQEEEIPFVGLRRKISEKMIQSVNTIPHATGMGEVDVTKLVDLRKNLIPFAEKHGCRLTFLPFIIKAVTKSLIENPYLNSTLDEKRGKIILKKYYNIGIATSTKEGLVVPIIKNADKKSILEIALELEELTEKARQRKLELADLQGGTFTISSTGKNGGAVYATPIINYPEAAILGIYEIKRKPVVIEEEIVIRSMMGYALSFDHRIMDGQETGQFLTTLTNILENPESMMLEVR
ncbi:dihydrolipoamide acetyltransferase family protein [Neobacillus niacini]|uniref:dihydrolipoamide acetyltransferase family protein n=1 Tax=Neobacillus niacini TaxID=86668 RepID=UPI00300011DB